MLTIVVWVVAIGLGLGLLDQLCLWAERKGWLYYRHRSASPGATRNAMLEMSSIVQPAAREQIAAIQEVVEESESGDPPEPRVPEASESRGQPSAEGERKDRGEH